MTTKSTTGFQRAPVEQRTAATFDSAMAQALEETGQKIDNIPVVSTFKNGSEIKRVNGFLDEAAMRAMIEEILK